VKGLALALFAASCTGALAATPPPGRAKSRPCAVCHGQLGISITPDAPHLAGQPRIYLITQLKAFRSGKRMSPVMNIIAKPLKDADITDLAEWYSSLMIEAKEKP
jgi:cytochrome c553